MHNYAPLALAFRSRANALIHVLDTLSRVGSLPEDTFSGQAAASYRTRHGKVVSAVTRLIDAYNTAASALEETLTQSDLTHGTYKVTRALLNVQEVEERLARLSLRLPKPSSSSISPVSAVTPIAAPVTTRENLIASLPSRPAANGAPPGFSPAAFRKLFAASISQAPSDEAARALRFAASNLGFPYSVEKRSKKGFFDCSSFVSSALSSAGLPVKFDGMLADTSMLMGSVLSSGVLKEVPVSATLPGDLLFYRDESLPPSEPGAWHVVLLLADGYIAHAPSAGKVTRIETINTSTKPVLALRIRS